MTLIEYGIIISIGILLFFIGREYQMIDRQKMFGFAARIMGYERSQKMSIEMEYEKAYMHFIQKEYGIKPIPLNEALQEKRRREMEINENPDGQTIEEKREEAKEMFSENNNQEMNQNQGEEENESGENSENENGEKEKESDKKEQQKDKSNGLVDTTDISNF